MDPGWSCCKDRSRWAAETDEAVADTRPPRAGMTGNWAGDVRLLGSPSRVGETAEQSGRGRRGRG